MTEATLVYVTAPERTLAEAIGRTLVQEKLAACVNVLGDIQSIYRWKGTVEEAKEVAFLVKTTAQQAEAVIVRIKALHPYECPAIVTIPVTGGFAPFLDWIAQESSD